MMGFDNSTLARDLAICNLVQTIRSTKTAEGFGSNYGAAGSHSVDRTEPPQAARVLATLYDKYNASYADAGGPGLNWLVELVLQDLLESAHKRPVLACNSWIVFPERLRVTTVGTTGSSRRACFRRQSCRAARWVRALGLDRTLLLGITITVSTHAFLQSPVMDGMELLPTDCLCVSSARSDRRRKNGERLGQ